MESFELRQKNILVTGASSGIGRATAIECAKAGANLILTGRDTDRLDQTSDEARQEGVEVLSIALDLTSDSLDEFINSLPTLDGAAFCHGITQTAPVQFTSKENLERILDINFISVADTIRKLLKKKKFKKGASIVALSSVLGTECFMTGNAGYGVSKAALESFIKYCALEYATKGIRFNVILPGGIETPMVNIDSIPEEFMIEDKKKYPMKRYGQPVEIAYPVIFLLSEASSFITGTSLTADGGRSLVF